MQVVEFMHHAGVGDSVSVVVSLVCRALTPFACRFYTGAVGLNLFQITTIHS